MLIRLVILLIVVLLLVIALLLEAIWWHDDIKNKKLLLDIVLRLSIEPWLIQLVNWYGFNRFFLKWASSTTSKWWYIMTIKRFCILPIILFFISEWSILKSIVTLSEIWWWHIGWSHRSSHRVVNLKISSLKSYLKSVFQFWLASWAWLISML